MDASPLFESELRRRGISFALAHDSGCYEISLETGRMLVSLDNLARTLKADSGDVDRVAEFVDVVVATNADREIVPDRLFWCFEPNNYAESAPYHLAVSRELDRVLSEVAVDESWLRWVTPTHLNSIGLPEAAASARALSNLDSVLHGANIRTEIVDGDLVAYLETDFASKASLLLAPSLRDVVGPIVGWPVLAVAPDRDFVYVWTAARRDIITRMAKVVTREYARAPYPLTTEVFEIGDSIQAIGAFPRLGE